MGKQKVKQMNMWETMENVCQQIETVGKLEKMSNKWNKLIQLEKVGQTMEHI